MKTHFKTLTFSAKHLHFHRQTEREIYISGHSSIERQCIQAQFKYKILKQTGHTVQSFLEQKTIIPAEQVLSYQTLHL